jgi:hypothetical protein
VTRNRHAADELADIRIELKQLRERELELRARLLMPDANLIGDEYRAVIRTQSRRRLDRNELIERFGEAAIAECTRERNQTALFIYKKAEEA